MSLVSEQHRSIPTSLPLPIRFQEHNTAANAGRDFAGVVVKGRSHEGEEVWGSAGANPNCAKEEAITPSKVRTLSRISM